MQAILVSRHLRDKFERIMRDGREQYALASSYTRGQRLAHLHAAEIHFAQAWMVADCAAPMAPTMEYKGWLDRRHEAGRHRQACATNAAKLAEAALGAEVTA